MALRFQRTPPLLELFVIFRARLATTPLRRRHSYSAPLQRFRSNDSDYCGAIYIIARIHRMARTFIRLWPTQFSACRSSGLVGRLAIVA
ncbi:hypothetical protein BDY19DRAFT_276 [Irpex rosettiformis]|uniref:Uncharacterized protein n=1 Tax=Irpex rosettiformis TaxID=378272 RepID=A0ACB8UJ12_9APHY|nr:hypothetical protein BDY19DRAFT_276 [Irpex rosettiformis]